jgi:hypothetical protein
VLLRTIAILLMLSAPLSAVVIGYNSAGSGLFGDPNSSTYTVGPTTVADGVNLSGVVEVGSGVGTCTGVLLGDDQSILTAAHCLLPSFGSGVLPSDVQVFFNYPGCSDYPFCNGTYHVTDPADMFIDPTWVSDGEALGLGNDLAVLRLSTPAPAFASVYSLFTGTTADALNTPVEVVGVGESGKGEIDAVDYPAGNQMRQGESEFIGTCTSSPILAPGCTSPDNLLAAFTPSSPLNNQVEIAPGDSGGPTFDNGQVVGIHEFISCENTTVCGITDPDTLWSDTFVGGSSATWVQSVELANVPEPAPPILLAAGLVALLLLRRAFIKQALPSTRARAINTAVPGSGTSPWAASN